VRLPVAEVLGVENTCGRRDEDASGVSLQAGSQAASMRTSLNLELTM
jgi:hypothetical protein